MESNMDKISQQSKKSGQSYLSGLDCEDPELEKERKNLWKIFGRETGAGKELFSLYRCHQPAKINYPKPKQKSQEEMTVVKEKKQCPQQTKIEYPPLSYKEVPKKYHPIDFVPKRRTEAEIREEIEKFKQNPYIPINRGVDRSKKILELQRKFKNQRGALPKGAELPMVDQLTEDLTDEQKQRAFNKLSKKDKNFSEIDDKTVVGTVISKEPLQELNDLFDEIMKEIEERQQFLDDIQNLDEPKLKEQIKKEVIERVSELQKITEMRKQYKKEL